MTNDPSEGIEALSTNCWTSRPRFLMLDEPSQGLVPLIVRHCAEIILQISDRAYLLEDGRIVFEGKSEEIRRNPDVMSRHLVL